MNNDCIVVPNGLARIDQYWGPWASEPSRLRAAMASIGKTDLLKHAAAYEAPGRLGEFRWDGESAVIDVLGTITKYGSSMSALAHGAIGVRKSIRRAAADPNAKQIVMVFDSPGGTVAGIDDLAEEVRRATAKKPVIAYCEDLCASAAYWIASQCTEVYANRSAIVGSIGVYMLVYDDSEAAEKEGVKAHLVKSAEFKGAGAPGVPVTDEQLAEWQRQVNEVHEQFRAAVTRGRGLTAEQFDAVATGQVWNAKEAVKMGLIDGVTSYTKLIERAGKRRVTVNTNSGKAARRVTMSVEDSGVAMSAAAYIEKLRGLCPGASADWLLEKATGNASIEEATAEHYKRVAVALTEAQKTTDALLEKKMEDEKTIKEHAEQLAKAAEENAALKACIDKLEARVAQLESGVDPIEATTGEKTTPATGSAKEQVEHLVGKRMTEANCDRHAAWSHVMQQHPDLRAALIREANEG